jgi:hypothetical protein
MWTEWKNEIGNYKNKSEKEKIKNLKNTYYLFIFQISSCCGEEWVSSQFSEFSGFFPLILNPVPDPSDKGFLCVSVLP